MIVSKLKTFLSVVFTALIAIVIGLTVPLDRKGKAFHVLMRFYSRSILKLFHVTVEVDGIERVDFSRNYIYVANHASLFDIPAVLVGIPDRIRIVYKRELERIPIFGWALWLSDTYIRIDRVSGQEAIKSLEEAARKIRTGSSVLMFAEGTRTPDGTLQPFKRGPFNLAMRAGVPVVPVAISGSYRVLPRKSWDVTPGTIKLILSDPIKPPPANGRETEIEFRDNVRSIIKANLGE